MTSQKSKWFLAATLLVAVAAGFGLAQLLPQSDNVPHSEGGDHGVEPDHQEASQHADEPGHNETADHSDGPEADKHEEHAPHDEESAEEGVVALTPSQIEASGIAVVNVGRGGGSQTRVSGRVQYAVDARAVVAATTAGRVEKILVASGSSVEAGQRLVDMISGEAAALRANADAARAEAQALRLAYRRDLNLVEQGIVARQEVEASRARSLAADATARAARAQVATGGSPDAAGRLGIVSPITGVVGSVAVTTGGFVASGAIIAEISDPSRVELVFHAAPALASEVASGARLLVTGPSGSFEAEVVGVAANADRQSGATVIRASAASDALPPAGSPVTAVVVTGDQQSGLIVPVDAVQTVDGRSVVFLADDQGFRVQPVLAGRRTGDYVEILDGLSGDERIAGSNAFLLKAELAKGEAEHGH
jgi:cobalt-zinc-cadmium efflux system membrane fusion protein